jgi:hypothetical protein
MAIPSGIAMWAVTTDVEQLVPFGAGGMAAAFHEWDIPE